jgi:polyribonucleotide nucleotidyltransferase
MYFKVCGTKYGITDFKMDLKLNGLQYELM